MFCKFCGQQIDRETMQCIGCGKTVGPLEGGVGFWDLAERGAPKTDTRDPQWNSGRLEKNMERIFAHQKYLDKKFAIVSGALIGMLALSLILNFGLIGITVSTRKDYKDIRSYLQELIVEGESAGEITKDGAEKELEITYQPSEEEIDENTPSDTLLFTVTAVGEDLEFCWQRYVEGSDEPIPITADDMYLHVEETPNEDGSVTSHLRMKEFSEEILGEYVCAITDRNGLEKVSDRVSLKPKKEIDNPGMSEQLETTAPVQDETTDEEMLWFPE